ncbi:MAG: hypothetical protein O2966_08545, partial [Proteobacteria bacterium]|nr:hypothetical protein [Pseudomonadota bacterium]
TQLIHVALKGFVAYFVFQVVQHGTQHRCSTDSVCPVWFKKYPDKTELFSDLSMLPRAGYADKASRPVGVLSNGDSGCQSFVNRNTITGLAPLEGILTDALANGHAGPIHLFHGSRDAEDLYRIDEMRQLAEQHPNFHYTQCLSGGHVPEGFASGRVNEIALSGIPDLKDWRVFLCGHPEMVNQMKKQVFLKGASIADIYTDAFLISTH